MSGDYIRTSCPPQEELQTWYKNLKENVGVSNERLKAGVRDRYRKAIIPSKTTKGLDRWIAQWENAMSEAIAKKIGEISETSFWFDDFAMAVQEIMPTWITMYRMSRSFIKSGLSAHNSSVRCSYHENNARPTFTVRVSGRATFEEFVMRF